MIYWLTESALVPLILGTLVALAFLGLAISFRDRIMFFVALLVAILTAGIAVTEIFVVTDREAITEIVQILAQAVEKNDLDGVLAHVSDSQQDSKNRIRQEMPDYLFSSCRIIGINNFTSSENEEPKVAEIDFVVIAHGSFGQNEGQVHRQIKLKFQLEPDGQWKLIDYDHSEPRGGLHL